MPVMSKVEAAFCRSAPWRAFAQRAVLPWALGGRPVVGEVLEIGGGSGAMAQALLDSQPGVRKLTMVDVDPDMVAAAGRRLAVYGERASAEVADVTALPFADESFDVVLSFLMLHHVVSWQACLPELHRVLRPDGVLLGYDLTANALTEVIHRADRSPVSMLRPDQLTTGLASSGFAAPEVRKTRVGGLMRFLAAA